MYAIKIELKEDIYSWVNPTKQLAKVGDLMWYVDTNPKANLIKDQQWGVPINAVILEENTAYISMPFYYLGNRVREFSARYVKLKPVYIQNGWEEDRT